MNIGDGLAWIAVAIGLFGWWMSDAIIDFSAGLSLSLQHLADALIEINTLRRYLRNYVSNSGWLNWRSSWN